MAAKEEVTLVVRARDLTRGVFRNLNRRIGGLRLSLGSLIAGGALGAAGKAATEAATEIAGIADQLGITVEEAQALQTIAADVNVPFAQLANVVQRVGRNFGGALRGIGPLEEFLELGIPLDRNRGALDVFLEVVEAAKANNIELSETQSILARIADSEGLNAIQRLIRGGGNLRVQIDDLASSGIVRSADEIRNAAQTEQELRRELLELQRQFAEQLRDLLPSIISLAETVNELAGIVNELRQGNVETAAAQFSDTATEALGLEPVRRAVRSGQGLLGGQSIGTAAFEANLFLQQLEQKLRAGIESAQAPLVQYLESIAGTNEEIAQSRGEFRLGP